MRWYKTVPSWLAIFSSLLMSACNTSSGLITENDMIALSEKELVLVVRSGSIRDFDTLFLKKKAAKLAIKYSLSKRMIPMTISETIQKPSYASAGYIMQHVRLLDWNVAQAMLNASPASAGLGSDAGVIDGNSFDTAQPESRGSVDSGATFSSDVLSKNALGASANTGDRSVLDECLMLTDKYETDVGNAMGDMCKGAPSRG